MKKSGFFWHIHHDILVGYSDDINERIGYIKKNKLLREISLRLKLLKPVMGKLPEEIIEAWEVYDRAREACGRAKEACDKAREVYDRAREACGRAKEACDKAWEVYDRAREACGRAKEAYHKAWEVYRKAWEAHNKVREACDKASHSIKIEALHKKECPNCPWNGHSIFNWKK